MRFVNRLTLLAVLLAFEGCSRGQAALQGKIADVSLDPQTGYALQIKLDVPKDNEVVSGAPGRYDYVVTANGRYSSFWNAAAPQQDGPDTVAVVLKPTAYESSPSLDDELSVKAVQHATGREIPLAQSILKKPPQAVLNPSLANFVNFPLPVPAGWHLGSDPQMGGAGRFVGDGRHGVEMHVISKTPDDWNTFELWQDVVAEKMMRFSVLIRPTHDCDGEKAGPTDVTGVAMRDQSGHTALYCVSSRVKRRTVNEFAEGREIITVFPGHLGHWNRMYVDLGSLQPYFRLYPTDEGTVRLSVELNVHPIPGHKRLPTDDAAFADIEPGDAG